jgi:hypothetical protein
MRTRRRSTGQAVPWGAHTSTRFICEEVTEWPIQSQVELRESSREPRTRTAELSPARCVIRVRCGQAQNREALTDRVTIIVRVRSQASGRDPDRLGRDALSGAGLSISGIAGQCEATRGREGAPAGLRRGHVCRELRGSECRWGRVPG